MHCGIFSSTHDLYTSCPASCSTRHCQVHLHGYRCPGPGKVTEDGDNKKETSCSDHTLFCQFLMVALVGTISICLFVRSGAAVGKLIAFLQVLAAQRLSAGCWAQLEPEGQQKPHPCLELLFQASFLSGLRSAGATLNSRWHPATLPSILLYSGLGALLL